MLSFNFGDTKSIVAETSPDLASIFSFSVDNPESILTLSICITFFAFQKLFSTGAVLDVIFWGELLLVTSIFGIALLSGTFGVVSGNGHAVLLLVAAAAEAGVGMLLVLEAGNLGVLRKFS